MTYQLYKMKIKSAHFGGGLLETTKVTPPAEVIFSALFLEAKKFKKDDNLLQAVKNKEIVMSDIFLYEYGIYFPKPISYPRPNNAESNDRLIGKLIKKIQYLHEGDFDDFTNGVIDEKFLEDLQDQQSALFRIDAPVKKGADPFRVGIVHYHHEAELCFIASKHPLLEELMLSLQYSGIGGKRSQGLGRFTLSIEQLENDLLERLTTTYEGPVMLLTKSLPDNDSMEEIVNNENTKYLLDRTGGFAFSQSSKENFRKQDYYKFLGGSTFGQTFSGDLVDIAPDNFPHPVWSYNTPLFYKLEVSNDES